MVYGGEKVFAAGADIKEMADMSYTDMVQRSGKLQSAFSAVARIPKPVVAAVTGYALGGGCELALCADVRFAADTAVLGQPEILLGHHPRRRRHPAADPAGRSEQGQGPHLQRPLRARPTRRWPSGWSTGSSRPTRSTTRRSPWARQFAGAATYAVRAAKETIDRGIEVDLETGLEIERQQFAAADEALAIGLVDRVVPAEQVYDAAVTWAKQFAGAATYAVRAAKESIDRGLEVDLETGLEIERQQFAALFATEDRRIGMESFVESGPGRPSSWVADFAP